jgi:hypothetical protein
MRTDAFAPVLHTIFREILFGSPSPADRTYLLNRGDAGLLASLDRLSTRDASANHDGGGSIASHADHVRYALALLNGWARGALPAASEIDWTASWKIRGVDEGQWEQLRAELRREAEAWAEALRTPREASEVEAGWMTGSVAHMAYHLAAIRQIARAARGPSAEDEARAERELRGN